MDINEIVRSNYDEITVGVKGSKTEAAQRKMTIAMHLYNYYKDNLQELAEACEEYRVNTLNLPKDLVIDDDDVEDIADMVTKIIKLIEENSKPVIQIEPAGALLDDDDDWGEFVAGDSEESQVEEMSLADIVLGEQEPIVEEVKPMVAKPKPVENQFNAPASYTPPVEEVKKPAIQQQPQQPTVQQQQPQQQAPSDIIDMATLKEKQEINHYALCVSCDIKETAKSRWLDLRFRDANGKTITGRLFGYKGEFKGFTGKVVKIEGMIENFNGLYVALKGISDENVKYSESDFVKSIPDLKYYMEELMKLVQSVKDVALNKMLNSIFFEKKFIVQYANRASSVSHHGVLKGDLLKHCVNVARTALHQAEINKLDVNKDVIIAATLLHDLGKVAELPPVGQTEYTMQGNLLGHIFIGANYVYNEAQSAGVDANTKYNLIHCILSHHGKKELGSPVEPKTLEATLVNKADELEAYAIHYSEALSNVKAGESVKDTMRNTLYKL